MYQSLLQICFLMEDPLGDDLTDFPILATQADIYVTSRDLVRACREFWQHRRAAGQPCAPSFRGPACKPKPAAVQAAPTPTPTKSPPRCPVSPGVDAADVLLQVLRTSAPLGAGVAADVK